MRSPRGKGIERELQKGRFGPRRLPEISLESGSAYGPVDLHGNATQEAKGEGKDLAGQRLKVGPGQVG
jgi:hypothetical protein